MTLAANLSNVLLSNVFTSVQVPTEDSPAISWAQSFKESPFEGITFKTDIMSVFSGFFPNFKYEFKAMGIFLLLFWLLDWA